MATDWDEQEWEKAIIDIDLEIKEHIANYLSERENKITFLNQKTNTWGKELLGIVLNSTAGELLYKYPQAKAYIKRQIEEAKQTKLPYIHKEPDKIDLRIEQKLLEEKWVF